jgi:hypothetical protein
VRTVRLAEIGPTTQRSWRPSRKAGNPSEGATTRPKLGDQAKFSFSYGSQEGHVVRSALRAYRSGARSPAKTPDEQVFSGLSQETGGAGRQEWVQAPASSMLGF